MEKWISVELKKLSKIIFLTGQGSETYFLESKIIKGFDVDWHELNVHGSWFCEKSNIRNFAMMGIRIGLIIVLQEMDDRKWYDRWDCDECWEMKLFVRVEQGFWGWVQFDEVVLAFASK